MLLGLHRFKVGFCWFKPSAWQKHVSAGRNPTLHVTFRPESWASFLPMFSLLCPSVLDLGMGMGQMDRRRPSMLNSPTLRGREHNNIIHNWGYSWIF